MTQRAGHHPPATCNVPGRAVLGAAISCALLMWSSANASPSAPADAEFDTSLLAGGGQQSVDLSRFERGNVIVPGIYRLDLYLAGQWAGAAEVRFAAPAPSASAVPCMTPALFAQLGLPQDKLPEPARALLARPDACVALSDLVADATVTFDQAELRLDVTVPQAWLGYRARGHVGPEQWDAGTTAALLNYNLNTYRSESGGQSQTAGYVGINAGFNAGAWRFRHDGNLTWQSAAATQPSGHHWQSIATYARRDIPALRAQLTLGDSFTSGEMFDSIGVRGAQLATDDRMLPDSLRGYAPTVRGVAETNARVTIRQNGTLVYETTVTPGAFAIGDLYATGYGGDLDVTITEADGRVRTFSVPYASVPQQLRPGTTRFAIAAGRVHDQGIDDEAELLQATVQHGITNTVTAYGGAIGSADYLAGVVGVSLNTPVGAVAFDVTTSRTTMTDLDDRTGQSYRATYSKFLPNSGTSFSLASYRYSTGGYLSLRDALLARDAVNGVRIADGDPAQDLPGVLTPAQREALLGERRIDLLTDAHGIDRQRNRFDLSVNQRLGRDGGSLFATASASDYWNREGNDVQFQVGYSHRFRSLSYSVSANRVRDLDGELGNQFFLSFSVPLGSSPRAPSMTAGLVHDSRNGQNQAQMSVAGAAGADNRITYGASLAYQDELGTSGSLSAGYRAGFGIANASYGQGDGYSQASFGLSGTMVAHAGGLTVGQPAGDTVGLVSAPNAAGARVTNVPGVRIDRFGYALVPYLTPYSLNSIELDPKGLPLDVQLGSTSIRVAPRAGAVSLLTFDTEYGRALLLRTLRQDGRPVPFGAEVKDDQGRVLGIVAQGGRALLRGAAAQGTVSMTWQEDGLPMQCTFTHQSAQPSGAATAPFATAEATCLPTAVRTLAAQ
ncbi:MAG TPA: fimbria/pilus outer membrane usher protein [Lysobacter sp.]